ncbi:MAG: hypothetical protein ACKO01_00600 [Erythrobacter sp.]
MLKIQLPLAALVLAIPAIAQAQNYRDLPPLPPVSDAELRSLPQDMRSAPLYQREEETREMINGVETITRTRRIDAPAPQDYGYQQGYAQQGYYGTPAVFEREQWVDECRRRTRGRNRNDTGLIIGGLLGAIGGGFAGNAIAGAGDEVLGTVLGVGGGGLIGGLIGSLFDGGRKKSLYDCEAALDSYLSAYGAPNARIASREIAYPGYYAAPANYGYGYGYPQAYSYGYTYAPPPQMVLVPVRTEVQQQVVVRENERYETYTVPGAERTIPMPSPKMIKYGSPKLIKNR